VSTYAHPFDICVCLRCGPPWRDTRPKPSPDDFVGNLTWNSYTALCPTCGSKRCPGAVDHDTHPTTTEPEGGER
jgi:hypothetical protein